VPNPDLDPRTPVLVGVGQASERTDDAGYRGLSAVGLAAEAAREALADTGADPSAVAAAVDTVAGVRQFEISFPGAPAPLGRSDNYPRSVARRVGADPARAILEVVGGQSPQHLVTELAGAVAAGRCEVALLVGSEAISTVRHLARADDRPDFTERVGGQLEDRGFGLEGVVVRRQVDHGLTSAASQYALCENARRARLGSDRERYAAGMGELFAPFSRVAATNPHAAAPTARTPAELATPGERNRMIADPYPRFLVSRDQVNQGAAAVLMSVAVADRLGVPTDRRVYLHGHADLRERDLLDRADLGAAPASVQALRLALDLAGVELAEVATLDLYSCFPIAVAAVADAFGLAADDPRGLTLTGGLPFFGGAGNNYSMHAIAETVHRARAAPGSVGLVGANGGILSKYSVGLYSTEPVGWRPGRDAEAQAGIDGWAGVEQARDADGWATVETYTVNHTRRGPIGVVVGRLESDGRRFLARAVDGDDDLLGLLTGGEPLEARVFVRSSGEGNRVATGRARLADGLTAFTENRRPEWRNR
jgi:acetyl-CoA C-acetyltransferase